MTRRDAFERQNEVGADGQRIVINLLFNSGWTVQKSDQDGTRDIVVTNKQGETLRIEIKNESRNWHTGRIAVETFNDNGISGLITTTADVWIHLLKDQVVLYRVPQMKQWLHDMKPSHKEIVFGKFKGETDGGCGGYLVPRYLVRMHAWCDECELSKLPSSNILRRPEPRVDNNKAPRKAQPELFNEEELPSKRFDWL